MMNNEGGKLGTLKWTAPRWRGQNLGYSSLNHASERIPVKINKGETYDWQEWVVKAGPGSLLALWHRSHPGRPPPGLSGPEDRVTDHRLSNTSTLWGTKFDRGFVLWYCRRVIRMKPEEQEG